MTVHDLSSTLSLNGKFTGTLSYPHLSAQLNFGMFIRTERNLPYYSIGVQEHVQKSDLGAIVVLFQLDATALGDTEIRYFTNTLQSDGSLIVHNGKTYTPVDFEFEGYEVNSQGGLPTPTVRVANVNKVFNSLVRQFHDLIGAKVTRMRTFETFLDGGDNEDPNAIVSYDIFTVAQKTKQNNVFIEWKLQAAMDQEGKQLPPRQVLPNVCGWRYREYDPESDDFITSAIRPCPYSGNNYFDINGNPTDKAGDNCGLTLQDCIRRFGIGSTLPYGGFPGVGRVS